MVILSLFLLEFIEDVLFFFHSYYCSKFHITIFHLLKLNKLLLLLKPNTISCRHVRSGRGADALREVLQHGADGGRGAPQPGAPRAPRVDQLAHGHSDAGRRVRDEIQCLKLKLFRDYMCCYQYYPNYPFVLPVMAPYIFLPKLPMY